MIMYSIRIYLKSGKMLINDFEAIESKDADLLKIKNQLRNKDIEFIVSKNKIFPKNDIEVIEEL